MRTFRLVVALTALAASSAFAQTATLQYEGVDRGTNLPPTSAAINDEATALSVNPAGLAGISGADLFYLHERAVNRGQVADALYLGLGLGGLSLAFSQDWMRSSNAANYRRTGFGLSLGSSSVFSLGIGFHWLSSDSPFIDGMSSIDLGMLLRPCRGFSFGFSTLNVDQPTRAGVTLPRHYDLAVAVRPLDERYTLAADYIFGDSVTVGRMQYTVQAEMLRGLRVLAGVSHGINDGQPLTFQLGIIVDSEYLGLGYALGGTSAGLDHIIQVRASTQKYRNLDFSAGKVALVDLDDRLSGQSFVSSLLGFGSEDPYLELMRFFDKASRDPELKAVVLKVNGIPHVGLGRVEELRQAVFRLRAHGKKVIAVVLTAEDPAYLLAIAADKVYALPESTLLINGLLANTTFLGGTMDKFAVHWDVARVGAYKNAPDLLTRSTMAPEQREATNAYLSTDVEVYEKAVEQARHLTPEQFRAALAEGFIPPRRAVQLGLVDQVMIPSELDQKIEAIAPGVSYDATYSPSSGRQDRWGIRKRIAIVPVLGSITGGKSRQDPFGGEAIAGAETVVKAIQRAEDDPLVEAIVIRVDSGGGDGLSSDLIYRAVVEAKRKKPVVASMGDVAASGGYLSAMGADRIFAEPTTITGSIGVFVLKPALQGLAGKVGITRDTISKAPLAEIMSEWRPWTPEEQSAAQKWVDAFYDDFISEVAKSRGLKKEQVDAVARGRVWSGVDAKARGLVDELGGLEAAIAEAKKRAHRNPDEDMNVVVYGEPHGLLARPGGEPGIADQLAAKAVDALLPSPALPQGIADLGIELGLSPWMFGPGGPRVVAAMEYQLTVR